MLNTIKRDWNANVTISHVFQVIRCLLIVPFPESALNDEAGMLFMESYDEYRRRAALFTSLYANAEDDEETEEPESGEGAVSGSASSAPSGAQNKTPRKAAGSSSKKASPGGTGRSDSRRKSLKRL